MATRSQFDDSERIPKKLKFEPEATRASDPLTKEEIDAFRESFLLLDKWDRKRKIA